MKERPILFSAPMVLALLEGRKTQTRRVVKNISPQLEGHGVISQRSPEHFLVERRPIQERSFGNFGRRESITCPFGVPGDRLWVREMLYRPDGDAWLYKADGLPVMVAKERETEMLVWAHHKRQDYCPSMFMPRWASRITLELADVRAQRVQEISEEDAKAEGVTLDLWVFHGYDNYRNHFQRLWDSINGKKNPWAANAWVWALSFRRIA